MKQKCLSFFSVGILLISNIPFVSAATVADTKIEESSVTKEVTEGTNSSVSIDNDKTTESTSDSTIESQVTKESMIEKNDSSSLDTVDSNEEVLPAEQKAIKDSTDENESSLDKKVFSEESISVQELAEKINELSFDDVLADFGGRVSAGSLNKTQHVTVPTEKEDIDRYQLDNAFQDLQTNSIEFVVDVLNHFTEYNSVEEDNAVSDMQDNLNSLILLKVYFDRWYSIIIDGVNLSDQMFFKQSSNKDILAIAEAIKKNPKILNSSLTGYQYRKVFQPYYGFKDVPELVEAFVYEQTKSNDYDSWFRQFFKGSIYEAQSKYSEVSVSVWDKVKNNLNGVVSKNESANGTDNLLLPLLTVKHSEGLVLASAPGIVIYSSKKQYGDTVDQVMNQTVVRFKNFFDTIIDTHTDTQKKEILKQIKTIPVYDTDRYKYDEGSNTLKFNYYDETNILSHEFYLAIGLTKNFSSSNATGNPQGITFKIAKINNGAGGTLAHEYMHSISHIILETAIDPTKYGFRERDHLETIASRVNNSPSYWGGLPWVIYESTDYASHTKDPLANSADRFQKPSDLQEYFGGYTSLVNIMDQVVAEVVLEMSTEDQVGYIRKFDRTTKKFKSLSENEIEELSLKTIDDLVDNDIVIVDKSVKDGEPGYNAYGENYYTKYSLYYPASIDEEPVAALSDSIQLFDTLMSLPEYTGWDAVVKFFSKNTEADNDLEALRVVTGNADMDFVKFKKIGLHENENKVKKLGLKDHSYNDLVALFKDNPSNFSKVKTDIYKHYIEETSEFRTSIFGEATENLWGEAPYIFDEQTGILTVESGNLGESSESPWNKGDVDASRIEKIIFSGKNTLPKNSKLLFSSVSSNRYLSSLKTIEGLKNLDSTLVEDMSYMFFNLSSLTTLDLKEFDTSKVKDMSYMFGSCNLNRIDLSNFDTSQVTTMENMFDGNNGIQELVLGENFRFVNPPAPALPAATSNGNESISGKWIKYDKDSNEYAEKSYTADELMINYGLDDLTSGTYIAEPSNVKLKVENSSNTGLIGENSVVQFTISAEDTSTHGKAENISISLNSSNNDSLEDIWIVEKELTLKIIDHSNQLIETKKIEITGGNSFSLPDLDDSSVKEYQLSITGENRNNTISEENINAEISYNNGYKNASLVTKGLLKIVSGAFKFESIPSELTFKTEKLNNSNSTILIDRAVKSWSIGVIDLRGTNIDDSGLSDRKDWNVYATAKPFKDEDGNNIDSTVLTLGYIENGNILELDEKNAVEIYNHSVAGEKPIENQKTNVNWDEESGIKAISYNNQQLSADRKYTTIVNFELIIEP